jgi:hypothetical protein
VQLFFSELPQPLLEPLPLDNLIIDKDKINEPFLSLSMQAMTLFVWMIDLMTEVINNAQFNHVTMKALGTF